MIGDGDEAPGSQPRVATRRDGSPDRRVPNKQNTVALSGSRLCRLSHSRSPCSVLPTMSSKFWFPSMSPAEIVDAFSGWGYSISPEQVSRPTSDFVLGVYSACLEQVTGITVDSLQESVEQSLATTENPVCRIGLSVAIQADWVQEIYSQALVHNLMLYHLCVVAHTLTCLKLRLLQSEVCQCCENQRLQFQGPILP